MDIYVLNDKFEKELIIDEFESCIWNIKYTEAGDFELYLAAVPSLLNHLKTNKYLLRDKDVKTDRLENVMIIESIETQTDIEQGDHFIIKGRDLKSLLARRVVIDQTILNGGVEGCVRGMIDQNVINPTDSKRKMPKVMLGMAKGYADTLKKQVTGDNLLEFITEVLNSYGLGLYAYVKNGNIYFELVKGNDLSDEQSVNPRIVFSHENENILTSDYVMDMSEFKNAAVVAGEGEGIARKKVTVGTAEGLNRYEVYVDSRNTSSNEGEISDIEYTNMLIEEGVETLAELGAVSTFDGEIETNGMYIYGKDFNLGDIVTVVNRFGIKCNPRIVGTIESFSDEGEKIIPEFSVWME